MALEKILARKHLDVAARIKERPLHTFSTQLEPTSRSLINAILQRTGFILECKKASPSRGLLRESYDPTTIARSYEPVASAISVITDGPFFQGDHDHLRQVREAVELPLICKDFVVHPYQIAEARLYGADAVLLIVAALEQNLLEQCLVEARSLGMDALVEVHNEDELDRALTLDAPLIGINNRDLRTLKTNLETTERLAPKIPAERIVIAESGIGDRQDVLRLGEHVQGFLIGTTLMQAHEPGRKARELIHGRVKICGLTAPDDARTVWQAGASYGGLIFAKKSPRFVDLEQAREICKAAPGLAWVGVFVDEEPQQIASIVRELGLSAVQLHGDEPPEVANNLRDDLASAKIEVWKAHRVRAGQKIPTTAETGADRVLLDTYDPHHKGGTGRAFDWSLLRHHPERDRLILAGGLTPQNAVSAESVGVWALDVNSGVESSPGVKSSAKITSLFANLRRSISTQLPLSTESSRSAGLGDETQNSGAIR